MAHDQGSGTMKRRRVELLLSIAGVKVGLAENRYYWGLTRRGMYHNMAQALLKGLGPMFI